MDCSGSSHRGQRQQLDLQRQQLLHRQQRQLREQQGRVPPLGPKPSVHRGSVHHRHLFDDAAPDPVELPSSDSFHDLEWIKALRKRSAAADTAKDDSALVHIPPATPPRHASLGAAELSSAALDIASKLRLRPRKKSFNLNDALYASIGKDPLVVKREQEQRRLLAAMPPPSPHSRTSVFEQLSKDQRTDKPRIKMDRHSREAVAGAEEELERRRLEMQLRRQQRRQQRELQINEQRQLREQKQRMQSQVTFKNPVWMTDYSSPGDEEEDEDADDDVDSLDSIPPVTPLNPVSSGFNIEALVLSRERTAPVPVLPVSRSPSPTEPLKKEPDVEKPPPPEPPKEKFIVKGMSQKSHQRAPLRRTNRFTLRGRIGARVARLVVPVAVPSVPAPVAPVPVPAPVEKVADKAVKKAPVETPPPLKEPDHTSRRLADILHSLIAHPRTPPLFRSLLIPLNVTHLILTLVLFPPVSTPYPCTPETTERKENFRATVLDIVVVFEGLCGMWVLSYVFAALECTFRIAGLLCYPFIALLRAMFAPSRY
ncbi:uncharacterized protein V1518DRAFT_413217 [Limtongia smithiae]|uniref:uncharacterized protein n=1 Tax=Limtongia smithiae TaxID=1125753 RepID=UPI0034CF3EF8